MSIMMAIIDMMLKVRLVAHAAAHRDRLVTWQ
jgi:hypothetical protein